MYHSQIYPATHAKPTACPDAPVKHFTGKKFFNPWPGGVPHGISGMFRWTFERLGKKRDNTRPPVPVRHSEDICFPSDRPRITWVGHSTFLIQMGGLNFLTDPVWSQRASPLRFAGPKRVSQPGVPFDSLPEIHAILVSHDHYDHLDSTTVDRLRHKYPQARWYVPLGVRRWLEKRGVGDVVESDWDEASEWKGATITCIPAQHFAGRSVTGRDTTLWCGWIVRAAGHAVMFAGDTGLHPEFDRITRDHGPISAALIPIGAYNPRWFMRPVHMDPDDAMAAYAAIRNVNAHNRCVFIPSHWGTFVLTDEPVDEPPRRLRDAWENAGFDAEDCVILRPGESFSYPP